ncbi:MAG: MBL fold metallo-hydrolase [Acidobacteriota bacterium]|nr:MBL fold metallo-hydrolase [Acidobacteriota bacterium]
MSAEKTGPSLQILPVGPLQCNCSILSDPQTREALIIDPGDEGPRIAAAVESAGLRVVALLHTHGHFDHIGASGAVAAATGAPIRIHSADRPLYDALAEQAALFGLRADPAPPPDEPIRDRERIGFGRFAVTTIHTPGHTPGSTCFLLDPGEDADPILFSGDTLFRRSIGRTDLWGGDTEQILESIREKLFTLPADLRVVCGHGPDTTIGEEKKGNPFVSVPL